jgi:hypothetical protein
MAVVEAGRMDLVDAGTSHTEEVEGEEADLTIEDLAEVYRRENGEEVKHHQSASLALVEEEVEGMVETGAVEEEEDGSWIHQIRYHDARACLSRKLSITPFILVLVYPNYFVASRSIQKRSKVP